MANRSSPHRLNRREAAAYLGVSPATLAKWAVTGHPALPYSRVGKLATYSPADLDRLIAQGRREFVVESEA